MKTAFLGMMFGLWSQKNILHANKKKQSTIEINLLPNLETFQENKDSMVAIQSLNTV